MIFAMMMDHLLDLHYDPSITVPSSKRASERSKERDIPTSKQLRADQLASE